MINIPVAIKILVPGYRKKWYNRSKAMIDTINRVFPNIQFGDDDDGPWIEVDKCNYRMHGFWSSSERDTYKILKPMLPVGLEERYMRIIIDYMSRFLYPHMRPDLKLKGYDDIQMFGFHGQHKDAISDIESDNDRRILLDIFNPLDDDIIINCGAYAGFGDMRMSSDIPNGHLYSVEANSACYHLLSRNISENGINNITPIFRAVWNEEIEMELESKYAQDNSLVSEVVHGTKTENIRTITIDQIINEYKLEKLDMLSLTLNGAEVEALGGAKNALSNLRPRIRLAGWYSRSGRKISEITKEILEQYDYHVFIGKRGNVMAIPRECI
jgi:FkbM family methyltransferase